MYKIYICMYVIYIYIYIYIYIACEAQPLQFQSSHLRETREYRRG